MDDERKSAIEYMKGNIDWWTYELKIREFYDKRHYESQKLSNEFSKLLVTNLIVINAGGILAIPTMNAFIFSGKASVIAVYWPAFAAFVIGLLLALACALVAYLNFQYWARSSWQRGMEHVNAMQQFHPMAVTDVQFREAAMRAQNEQKELAEKTERKLTTTNFLSFALGIGSVVFFLGGVGRLIWIAIRS